MTLSDHTEIIQSLFRTRVRRIRAVLAEGLRTLMQIGTGTH
jgi:hypothetical protein